MVLFNLTGQGNKKMGAMKEAIWTLITKRQLSPTLNLTFTNLKFKNHNTERPSLNYFAKKQCFLRVIFISPSFQSISKKVMDNSFPTESAPIQHHSSLERQLN